MYRCIYSFYINFGIFKLLYSIFLFGFFCNAFIYLFTTKRMYLRKIVIVMTNDNNSINLNQNFHINILMFVHFSYVHDYNDSNVLFNDPIRLESTIPRINQQM